MTFATYENFLLLDIDMLDMKNLKIGTLKYYLADEGDLLTLLEHPGHPADTSEDDPRHALPHGAQPLQVVQRDHQGHARARRVTCAGSQWLTVQLSTAHILRAVLRPGPGQQLVFRAECVGARRGNLGTASQVSEQISRYRQWWRRDKYCLKIVLWSVSLLLIIQARCDPRLELEVKVREDFTFTEKASTRPPPG